MSPVTGLVIDSISFDNEWNDNILELKNYSNGKLHGLFKTMQFGGDEIYISEVNWKNGIEHGAYKYDDGSLRQTGKYNDGKKEGRWRTFWYGHLNEEGNYNYGMKEGMHSKWYIQTDILNSKKKYVNGTLISAKCWDENGNAILCN
tara:strand:+ start:213 stop:650 length:438 start_codon:yes stop_codon:yes gene_type:complete